MLPLDLSLAPRVDTPERSYRVSRCCGLAFTWKGSARPGCPICGGVMATTTRQLRQAFVVLEGELLELAERLPGGLQHDAQHERDAAQSLREREAHDRELLAQGSGVRNGRAWRVYYPELRQQDGSLKPSDRPFVQSEYPEGSGQFGLGGSSLAVDLSESIAKAEAKAARYERRLERLGGPLS